MVSYIIIGFYFYDFLKFCVRYTSLIISTMEINIPEICDKIRSNVYSISSKRGTSIVWNVYGYVLNENGDKIEGAVSCKQCFHVAKYAGRATTNLLSHSCVKAIKPCPENTVCVSTTDKKKILQASTKMCIQDLSPFTIVEGTGFVELTKICVEMGAKYGEHVNVKDMLSAATTVGYTVDSIVEKMIPLIKTDLQSALNFGCTTDVWTDDFQKRSFLGVTIHYIKDDCMIDRVLAVEEIRERHTAENILNKLKYILGRYLFDEFSKIAFVTDRGANIVKALEHEIRLSCADHVINNVLSKATDNTPVVAEVFRVASKLVKYTKKSNVFRQLETTLKADCPTRWNTKFDMCYSILKNYGQLTSILQETGQINRLNGLSSPVLTEIVGFLELFKTATVELEKSKPTLYLVFPYFLAFVKKCVHSEMDSDILKSFKSNVKIQLDNVMFPIISIRHKVATFLYPPCRMMSMTTDAERQEIVDFIKTLVLRTVSAVSTENTEAEPPVRDLFAAFDSTPSTTSSTIFEDFNDEPTDPLDEEIKKYKL